MKKSRYTESQIMEILKKGESGVPVPDLCREYGMSSASYYKWRAKFGGSKRFTQDRFQFACAYV